MAHQYHFPGPLASHHSYQFAVDEGTPPGHSFCLGFPPGLVHLGGVEFLGRQELPVPLGGGVDYFHCPGPVTGRESPDGQPIGGGLAHRAVVPLLGFLEETRRVLSNLPAVRRSSLRCLVSKRRR